MGNILCNDLLYYGVADSPNYFHEQPIACLMMSVAALCHSTLNTSLLCSKSVTFFIWLIKQLKQVKQTATQK